jgi:ATP synthase protein I
VTDPRSQDGIRGPNLRSSLRRDLRRYSQREPGNRTFWQSLGVLGAVGWPIVLATVGGALLGRWLDARWNTGIRFTLFFMMGGVVGGGAVAWHLIQPHSR